MAVKNRRHRASGSGSCEEPHPPRVVARSQNAIQVQSASLLDAVGQSHLRRTATAREQPAPCATRAAAATRATRATAGAIRRAKCVARKPIAIHLGLNAQCSHSMPRR